MAFQLIAKNIHVAQPPPNRSRSIAFDPRSATMPSKPGRPLCRNRWFAEMSASLSRENQTFSSLSVMAQRQLRSDPDGILTDGAARQMEISLLSTTSGKNRSAIQGFFELLRQGALQGLSDPEIVSAWLSDRRQAQKMAAERSKMSVVGDRVLVPSRGDREGTVIAARDGHEIEVMFAPNDTAIVRVDQAHRIASGLSKRASSEERAAALKRALPEPGFLPKRARNETGKMTSHGMEAFAARVMRKAESFLDRFDLPGMVDLRFGGIRRARHDQDGRLKNAIVEIFAEVRTPVGHKVRLTLPWPYSEGKLYEPSVFLHENKVKLVSQHEFDRVFNAFKWDRPRTNLQFSHTPVIFQTPATNLGPFDPPFTYEHSDFKVLEHNPQGYGY